MSDIAKKVKDKIVDVKDKAVGSDNKEREVSYTSSTKSYSTMEYEANEPMSPAKIKEHEPTAVRKQDYTSSSGLLQVKIPKRKTKEKWNDRRNGWLY